MGYILVKPEVLDRAGVKYYEKTPDGRAIADFRMMKMLGSVKEVEIVSTAKELKEMMRNQASTGKVEQTEGPKPEEQKIEGESVEEIVSTVEEPKEKEVTDGRK